MIKIFKSKLFLPTLFVYLSAILINYIVRQNLSLHVGKDGGSVAIALFHCISSYLFFVFLHRSLLTFLGLGLLVGLFSCIVEIAITNIIDMDYPTDWFNYMLVQQFIATTIIVLLGIIYLNYFNQN